MTVHHAPSRTGTSPGARLIIRSLILLVALAAAAPAARAQGRPLRVSGQHDLTFGTVFPGVTVTVRPSDATNSGRIQIAGPKLARVQVTFSLPPAMTGSGGGSMPLAFGPTDAAYSPTGAVADQQAFDPRTSQTVTLDGNGRGVVFLGGTLRPAAGQRAGSYAATITMTISLSGL